MKSGKGIVNKPTTGLGIIIYDETTYYASGLTVNLYLNYTDEILDGYEATYNYNGYLTPNEDGTYPITIDNRDVLISCNVQPRLYKLTYYVDGEEYYSQDFYYNYIVYPIAEPTKNGYTFSGWSNIPKTMPAYDVKVTGTFTFTGTLKGVGINGIYYNITAMTKAADVTLSPNNYSGDIIIPNTIQFEGSDYTVSSIGEKAFWLCDGITSINIPNSVTGIGKQAFGGNQNLTDIYCNGESVPTAISAFDETLLESVIVHVPNASLDVYKTDKYWKEFKFIVGLDDVVTESDHIYSDGLSIYQGYTANLEVKMVNENTFTAYQFDLVLPEGITLATDENGNYLISKSDRYSDNTQQVKVEKYENNTYCIMSFSMQNGIIKGNDGVILTITLKADEEITVGNTNAEIRNIILTLPDETKIKTKPVTFSMEVNMRLKGDADGDGEIDVADIVAMINYIMGQPSGNFVMPAADLNDDGEIDIFDVMKAINLVFSQKKSTRSCAISTRGPEEQPILKVTDDRIILGVNDASRFTAFQFDVELTNAAELKDVCLNAETHHDLQFVRIGQDTYRVIGVSMDNSTLTTNENDFVELRLSKECDAQISNIVFVTPDETKVHFVGSYVNLTGIGSITLDQSEEIFDLFGRKIDAERSRLPKGIYIINNKKVFIK